MSGKDLLAGMSYVDEKYVDEAQNQSVKKSQRTPWMKWISLAACLCVVVGIVSFFHFWSWDAAENMSSGNLADADTQIGVEGAAEIELAAEDAKGVSDAALLKTASVILRVDSWTETGFTATVTELVDTDAFEVGMELNVVLKSTAETERSDSSFSTVQDSAAQKQNYDEGSLVQVQFLSYDEQTGTIIVNEICAVDRSGGQ